MSGISTRSCINPEQSRLNSPKDLQKVSEHLALILKKVDRPLSNTMMTVNGYHYQVKNQWHSQPRPIRVICVGAGAAGLLVAYKLKRTLKLYDLVVYEK